jgi:hypothetical protein
MQWAGRPRWGLLTHGMGRHAPIAASASAHALPMRLSRKEGQTRSHARLSNMMVAAADLERQQRAHPEDVWKCARSVSAVSVHSADLLLGQRAVQHCAAAAEPPANPDPALRGSACRLAASALTALFSAAAGIGISGTEERDRRHQACRPEASAERALFEKEKRTSLLIFCGYGGIPQPTCHVDNVSTRRKSRGAYGAAHRISLRLDVAWQ